MTNVASSNKAEMLSLLNNQILDAHQPSDAERLIQFAIAYISDNKAGELMNHSPEKLYTRVINAYRFYQRQDAKLGTLVQ